jgi:hypothetical protein
VKISRVRNGRFSRGPAFFSESGVFDPMKRDFGGCRLTLELFRKCSGAEHVRRTTCAGLICVLACLCVPKGHRHAKSAVSPLKLCILALRARVPPECKGAFFRRGNSGPFSRPWFFWEHGHARHFALVFSGNQCARDRWTRKGTRAQGAPFCAATLLCIINQIAGSCSSDRIAC